MIPQNPPFLPTTPAEANNVRGSELRSIDGFGGVHPRFDEAYLPAPGEQISEHAECPACGHTSADFGRWRKAESYEEADADGEIYECGYCGENRIIPSLPNSEVTDAKRSVQ